MLAPVAHHRWPASRAGALIALLLIVAACGSTSTPNGSAAPSDMAVASPAATPVAPAGSADIPPSVAPSIEPSATPSIDAAPTPKPAAWSQAAAVKGLAGCGSIVLAVDEAGASHLAATCTPEQSIRYASSADGRTWKVTAFTRPAGRLESEPQLAFDRGTLYLADTVLAPTDGSCGDDGLTEVGVYLRTRDLPSGTWSAARRIGAAADHLQSLRVAGGTIHATVRNEKDGKTYYETVSGATTKRVVIADAAGSVALRVGDDAMARIAYERASGIGFGSFDGSAFRTTTIPSSSGGWDPVFALAPGNVASVLWNRSYHGLGCAEPGPDPADGTYFATNAGGSWQTTKVSGSVGAASITIDPSSGEVNGLIDTFESLVHLRKAADGDWIKETLAKGTISSGVLRQNPVTGGLVVAYVLMPEGKDPVVMVQTKG